MENKKKRNIFLVGLIVIVAVISAYISLGIYIRIFKRWGENWENNKKEEEYFGPITKCQNALNEKLKPWMEEQKKEYSYKNYQNLYILHPSEGGYGAEIMITVEADWDEQTLLFFGEDMWKWSAVLYKDKSPVLVKAPELTVKMKSNTAFHLVANETDGVKIVTGE